MSKIDDAYELYKQKIYDRKTIELLKKHNLKVAGHIHSVLWELFCAIITGQNAEGNTGADLHGWEVKSAKGNGSFEYQYHRNAHLSKLAEDKIVNHIFCSYSAEYDSVIVRVMKGKTLSKKYFDPWKPLCIEQYKNPDNLRFRKSIAHSYIKNNGLVILEIANGELIFKNDNFEAALNNT